MEYAKVLKFNWPLENNRRPWCELISRMLLVSFYTYLDNILAVHAPMNMENDIVFFLFYRFVVVSKYRLIVESECAKISNEVGT